MAKIFFNSAATGSHSLALVFDRENVAGLRSIFAHSPQFAATPLLRLTRLARQFGLRELWAKDERLRWGQGSFKALGGCHAVVTISAEALSRQTGRAVSPAEIFAGRAPKADKLTFAAATAGNHGRAVAFGAKLAGARAVIFVYGDVPAPHVMAIARLGAEVVTVGGDYEAASSEAAAVCEREGWILVSDMAQDGYTAIPECIMMGYSVLSAEALEQLPSPPTHLFLQAGVGGLAAATASYFVNCVRPKPVVTVVEAETVPCLMESARTNRETRRGSSGLTNLNRLDCPSPSSSVWPVLRALTEAFVGVDNATASEALKYLAGAGIATTPTGAAGLAGLIALSREQGGLAKLGIGPDSRVFIVITEQPVIT